MDLLENHLLIKYLLMIPSLTNVNYSQIEKNAMNPSDGILLCRLCDKAFEDGHLQLKENYEIIVTEKLRKSENTTVNSWLSKINSKIPIKSNSKFTPDKEFIQKKLKSI